MSFWLFLPTAIWKRRESESYLLCWFLVFTGNVPLLCQYTCKAANAIKIPNIMMCGCTCDMIMMWAWVSYVRWWRHDHRAGPFIRVVQNSALHCFDLRRTWTIEENTSFRKDQCNRTIVFNDSASFSLLGSYFVAEAHAFLMTNSTFSVMCTSKFNIPNIPNENQSIWHLPFFFFLTSHNFVLIFYWAVFNSSCSFDTTFMREGYSSSGKCVSTSTQIFAPFS